VNFQMRKVPANTSRIFPDDTYVVEKVLDGKECYLVARYEEYGKAKYCLDALRLSMEVAKGWAHCDNRILDENPRGTPEWPGVLKEQVEA
jgi:hypothetical protein